MVVINDRLIRVEMNQFGKEIEVITRTPKKNEKDSKGKIVYNEESSTVTARIIENTGNETIWNNAIQQNEGATGLFFLEDGDKLNENSRLIYNGEVFYMKKPIKRMTHWEVPLSKKVM